MLLNFSLLLKEIERGATGGSPVDFNSGQVFSSHEPPVCRSLTDRNRPSLSGKLSHSLSRAFCYISFPSKLDQVYILYYFFIIKIQHLLHCFFNRITKHTLSLSSFPFLSLSLQYSIFFCNLLLLNQNREIAVAAKSVSTVLLC